MSEEKEVLDAALAFGRAVLYWRKARKSVEALGAAVAMSEAEKKLHRVSLALAEKKGS